MGSALLRLLFLGFGEVVPIERPWYSEPEARQSDGSQRRATPLLVFSIPTDQKPAGKGRRTSDPAHWQAV